MQSLRRARLLARLVLAAFALTLGIAIASPIVNPQGLELVCSASGSIKLLVQGDDGSAQAKGHGLDCPLCAATGAPPPAAPAVGNAVLPLALAVQPIPAARIAALTAAPLPARGPPSSLST